MNEKVDEIKRCSSCQMCDTIITLHERIKKLEINNNINVGLINKDKEDIKENNINKIIE
jgi:hypothetical protein